MPTATAPARPAPAANTAQTGRRRFIRLLGGGAVVAIAAPVAGCAAGVPDAATQPWRTAPQETDLRRWMLAHALLAPNPHNRQPWIADLSQPDAITLVCDGQRLLPHTDPHGRQILVGCGAFIELAVIAASHRGVVVTVEPYPDGPPAANALPAGTRVATLRLGAPGSATPDPLHAQITRRHTNKTAYADGRPLPAPLLADWARTAVQHGLRSGVVTAADELQRIRRLTREAYEIECVTPRTWIESAELMRIGPAAIERHRDGISIAGAMPRLMHTLGLFDPMDVPQRGNANHGRVMERWQAHETGSGFLWLASPGTDRRGPLDAGRAYVRMHLQATAAGVDLHPLSQPLQEFPEVRGPYDALHRALGVDPRQGPVQMLARTGYALAPDGPSPRRGLPDLLRA